jgi:hypothetical protein
MLADLSPNRTVGLEVKSGKKPDIKPGSITV